MPSSSWSYPWLGCSSAGSCEAWEPWLRGTKDLKEINGIRDIMNIVYKFIMKKYFDLFKNP